VFKRVDTLFGIESQIAKAEWAIEPELDQEMVTVPQIIANGQPPPQPSNTTAPPAPTAGPLVGLTKSIADALLKKLSRTPFPLPILFLCLTLNSHQPLN
jgi:hypothetical protein